MGLAPERQFAYDDGVPFGTEVTVLIQFDRLCGPAVGGAPDPEEDPP